MWICNGCLVDNSPDYDVWANKLQQNYFEVCSFNKISIMHWQHTKNQGYIASALRMKYQMWWLKQALKHTKLES